MGTGQMMITIGAIMLLTLVILRVNNNFLGTDVILMRSKFGILAVSLANSIIEDASGKAFDENTLAGGVDFVNELTDTLDLGPDDDEKYLRFDTTGAVNDFDDFDDFDGLQIDTKNDSTLLSAVFTGYCKVDYVTLANLDGKSGTRTWHKKITVRLTSKSMTNIYTDEQDTLTMSSIFSYWYYR